MTVSHMHIRLNAEHELSCMHADHTITSVASPEENWLAGSSSTFDWLLPSSSYSCPCLCWCEGLAALAVSAQMEKQAVQLWLQDVHTATYEVKLIETHGLILTPRLWLYAARASSAMPCCF